MTGGIAAPAQQGLTPVAVALQRLLERMAPVGIEQVPLDDALGRVLAEDVCAAHPLPGCDNSAMDGFAVRASDCTPTPTRLPVAAESRAGAAPPQHRAGTATRISTGAPLPHGADSVVPVEDTTLDGDAVTIRVAVEVGSNVRRTGEDAATGDLMVRRGARLRAVDVGVLAAAGRASVMVHAAPRMAIVAGGDELVRPGTPPLPHQVVDSNSRMLAAAVREAGGVPAAVVNVPDDRDAMREALRDAASCSDLILSSAGVSVGAHDHVLAVVEELGEVIVWRVAMRPGKPLLIGSIAGTPLLGLPGNPVSAAVCFAVFVRPALLALQGASAPIAPAIAVRLGEHVVAPRDLDTYLRVALAASEDGVPLATLSGGQGSAMLRPLAAADALLRVPAGIGCITAGSIGSAVPLR